MNSSDFEESLVDDSSFSDSHESRFKLIDADVIQNKKLQPPIRLESNMPIVSSYNHCKEEDESVSPSHSLMSSIDDAVNFVQLNTDDGLFDAKMRLKSKETENSEVDTKSVKQQLNIIGKSA